VDDEAIKTIKLFLQTRNFDASKAKEGVQDGHWILATIDQLCSACCRDSYEAGIRNVLKILECGEYCADKKKSDWLPQSSALVRQRAGMQ
tara:strand:+ start:4645 stop:4914 length:270 start_codon:yes stop_codon:yes gene_type:complete